MPKIMKGGPLTHLVFIFLLAMNILAIGSSDAYSCGGTNCEQVRDKCIADLGAQEQNCEKQCDYKYDTVPCLENACPSWFPIWSGKCSNSDYLPPCLIDNPDCCVYPGTCGTCNLTISCGGDSNCNQCVAEANCPNMLKGCKDGCKADPQYDTTSCTKDYEECIKTCPTTTVITSVTPPSSGTIWPWSGFVITKDTNGSGYQDFSMTASHCYHFDKTEMKWGSNDMIFQNNPQRIWNVGMYVYLDAYFAINRYYISSSAGSGGTISPYGTTWLDCDQNMFYSVQANTCYHIKDVIIDTLSQSNVYGTTSYSKYFTNVESNHSISATFANTYTVKALKSASTGTGSITSSPVGLSCGDTCASQSASFIQDCAAAPSSVTLTATPDSDSSFAGWTGACSGTGTCALTMNGDKEATATFNILPPVAAFTATPTTGSIPSMKVNFTNQSIRPWPAWADTYTWDFGDGTIGHEQNPQHVYKAIGIYAVTLTVKNPTGTDTFGPVMITVSACPNLPVRVTHPDNSVSGYYSTVQDAYNNSADGDLIRALEVLLIGDLNANSPKAVTLTGGYACDYQSRIGTTPLQGSITVNDGMLTVGDFDLVSGPTDSVYSITATAGSGGGISPAGTVTTAGGSDQTFTITPNPNYFILDVLIDGLSTGPVGTYAFSNVTTNHRIEAVFSTTYTINATAGPNGSISPAGAATVVANHDQTFTITPDTGYHVKDVLVDGVSAGLVTSYTFTSVTADHTISANFEINTYTVTASSGLGGNISPSGTVSVTHGSNQSFTMTADLANGYQLLDVLIDGTSAGIVSSYTFTNVTKDHAIRAVYSSTLAVNKTGSGTGLVTSSTGSINCGTSCSGEYLQGSSVTLTAVPDSNSLFAGWSGACTGTDACLVTLNTDTTATATFNLKPPVPDFVCTPTTGIPAVMATCTDFSLLNPTSWLWNFGDGTTSTMQNPTHTYGVVGTYNVTLTATNAGGSNTTTKTGYIVVQPYAKIAGSPVVYRNIQEAYDAASDGATIQVLGISLTENFNANAAIGKTIILEGGYDSTFTTASGVTTLKGSLTTTTGNLTVKNFILQK